MIGNLIAFQLLNWGWLWLVCTCKYCFGKRVLLIKVHGTTRIYDNIDGFFAKAFRFVKLVGENRIENTEIEVL